jgi:hypothetical protein
MRSQTRWKTALVAMLFASACLSGCGRRVVLVPPGEPVRLRQTVKKAKIWAADKNGTEVPGEVDLPEGWYAVPPPDPEPTPAPVLEAAPRVMVKV